MTDFITIKRQKRVSADFKAQDDVLIVLFNLSYNVGHVATHLFIIYVYQLFLKLYRCGFGIRGVYVTQSHICDYYQNIRHGYIPLSHKNFTY